jgi:hypothetical protein
MILTGETEVVGEKSASLPLSPRQIPHELPYDEARASDVSDSLGTATEGDMRVILSHG